MDKFMTHDELEQSLLEQGAKPSEVKEIFDALIYYDKKTNFAYFDNEKDAYVYRPVLIEKFEDTSGWWELFETSVNSIGQESSTGRLFVNYLMPKVKVHFQEDLFQFANYRNRQNDSDDLYWCYCQKTGRFIFVHVEN